MSFTRYSLEDTKEIIYNIKKYTKNISKNIESGIQNKIISPLVIGWHSEEGVIYIESIKENLTALSYELAVSANETIENVVNSYDNWLRKAKNSSDEEEAEIAKNYWYISFSPNNQIKTSSPISVDKDNIALSYQYTRGGDRREFGYLKSEETKITLDSTGLSSSKSGSEIEIGIDANIFEDVISNISSIFNSLESVIASYQSQLSNHADQMGYDSGMSRAVSNYKSKMTSILNKYNDYLTTGLNNCKGVSTKLNEVIDKYGNTIVKKIARDIEVDFSDLLQ